MNVIKSYEIKHVVGIEWGELWWMKLTIWYRMHVFDECKPMGWACLDEIDYKWMGFKEKNGVNLLDNWYLVYCTRVVMKDKDYVG